MGLSVLDRLIQERTLRRAEAHDAFKKADREYQEALDAIREAEEQAQIKYAAMQEAWRVFQSLKESDPRKDP